MEWRKAEGNNKPNEPLVLSGNRYLIYRNIEEKTNDEGVIYYTYEEKIVSDIELTILEEFNNLEIKREAEIIDDYTMQLINEGVI